MTDHPRLGEGALAHATERYASLFTHHPLAAYSVDRHGYYTDANRLALEMTGLSLEEMRRTHFSDTIHPEDRHLIQDGFDRALEGEPVVVEARVLRTDGEVIDIRCTGIPVVVDDEVVGVHGVTEDVTRAKQVVRDLEAANRAKTLFLATVSHEVRTPLAVLVGATELLMAAELDAETGHYADMVHRSSQRLMRLVDDVLEFSGLEAHQAVLQPRPYDVRALVDDLRGWAEPFAERRGLAIGFQVDDSVPATLVGDRRRTSQLLRNLVHNAVKFTEQGRIDVRVEASPDAGRLAFVVTDTGIGIAEDHLRSLFEPFTQVFPHAAGDRQGIGLGLTISRLLAELMGGEVRATSCPGEGSTFTLEIPLEPCAAGSAG